MKYLFIFATWKSWSVCQVEARPAMRLTTSYLYCDLVGPDSFCQVRESWCKTRPKWPKVESCERLFLLGFYAYPWRALSSWLIQRPWPVISRAVFATKKPSWRGLEQSEILAWSALTVRAGTFLVSPRSLSPPRLRHLRQLLWLVQSARLFLSAWKYFPLTSHVSNIYLEALLCRKTQRKSRLSPYHCTLCL